jgi:hydroxymethylglutaryl-CoA reductase (NADPH)
MVDDVATALLTQVPTKWVGPVVSIDQHGQVSESLVPLATYETPLWASVNRGAKITRLHGGIHTTLVHSNMTRSIVVEGPHAGYLSKVLEDLAGQQAQLAAIVHSTSRFANFKGVHSQILGNLLYLRFSIGSMDASGHNMATKAAEALLNWLLSRYESLRYVSISANICVDKKVSAINSILGRGRYLVAEVILPAESCQEHLHTTPLRIVALNTKKNLLGSILAGSTLSANAHVANMLLALYLATGQDAANIVEGSQAITYAELRQDALYFSVTLPNIIVGTIGNGKHLDFVVENLTRLGCLGLPAGQGSDKLAHLIAATVLCGELSLLAAQTNPGELMATHLKMERS